MQNIGNVGRCYTLLSSALQKEKTNEHKLNYKKFHLNTVKNIFYCECSQALEQVVQRDCGIFMLEDIWNLIGSM